MNIAEQEKNLLQNQQNNYSDHKYSSELNTNNEDQKNQSAGFSTNSFYQKEKLELDNSITALKTKNTSQRMLEGFTKRQQLFSGPKITPKFTSPQYDESLENFTIDEIKDDAPSQEKVFNLNQIQKYNQSVSGSQNHLQNKGQIVINAPNGTGKTKNLSQSKQEIERKISFHLSHSEKPVSIQQAQNQRIQNINLKNIYLYMTTNQNFQKIGIQLSNSQIQSYQCIQFTYQHFTNIIFGLAWQTLYYFQHYQQILLNNLSQAFMIKEFYVKIGYKQPKNIQKLILQKILQQLYHLFFHLPRNIYYQSFQLDCFFQDKLNYYKDQEIHFKLPLFLENYLFIFISLHVHGMLWENLKVRKPHGQIKQVIKKIKFIPIFQHQNKNSYTENLRDLTNYLTENQVNQDLQSSAKKFLEYIHQDVRKKLGAEHNLRNLSHSLKTKIIIDVFMKYVQNVPIFDYYFSNPLFQEALCCRVSEQIYGPDEIIKEAKRPQVPSIYIIMKGKVQLYLPDATNQKRSTTHLEYKKDYSIFGEVEFFTQQFDSLCSAKSIGVTQILAINLYDFLDLLKDFPRENEVYCYLKDSLVFTNQFDKIDLYCHACNSHKHTLTNCHEVFYEKKNDRIIRNYEKNLHCQINKFKRSQKRKKHNPVLNSAHNESVIFKLVQKLQDEQQTTYYYDDSYYSSDDTYEYDEYDEDEYVQNDHGVKSISRINTAPQQDMNTNFDKRSQKKKYTGDSKKFEPDNMTIKSKSQKRQTSFRSIISGKSLRSIKSQKSIKSSLKQSQFQESVVRQQSNSSHRFKAPQFYRASMSEIEQQNSLKNAYQNQYQVKPRVYTLSSYDDRNNNNNNSNQVRPFNPDNFQGLSEVVVSQKNRQRGFSGFSLISRVSSTSQYIAPSPLFLPSQAVQIEYESDPQKSWFEEGRGTNGTKKSQDPQRHYVQENQNFDQLVDQLTEKMTDKYGYDNNLSIVDERFQFESQHNFNFYHPKGNANLDMKSPFYQPNRRKISSINNLNMNNLDDINNQKYKNIYQKQTISQKSKIGNVQFQLQNSPPSFSGKHKQIKKGSN